MHAVANDSAEWQRLDSAVCIAVSSLAKKRTVVIGGAIKIRKSIQSEPTVNTLSYTLSLRTEQNLYAGELAAMAYTLN